MPREQNQVLMYMILRFNVFRFRNRFLFFYFLLFCYYYMYIFVSRVFSFFFCLCQTFFNATFLSVLWDVIQTESGDPEPQKLHDPSNIECVTVNGSHSHSCIWMLTLLASRASTIHDFFFFFFTIPPRVGREWCAPQPWRNYPVPPLTGIWYLALFL